MTCLVICFVGEEATTDFPVVGDVVSFLSLEAVDSSSSLFFCFNSVSLLLREDPTLLGCNADFDDLLREDLLREDLTLLGFNANFDEIDLSGVTSESLSLSFSA